MTKLTREQAQAKIAELAKVFRNEDLFPTERSLYEMVLIAVSRWPKGEKASVRRRLEGAACGAPFTLRAVGALDLEDLPAEAILAAFSIVVNERDYSMLKFMDMAAAAHGPALTTEDTFEKIDPMPTQQRINAQFGVHVEEFAEMLEECKSSHQGLTAKMELARTLLEEIGAEFKSGKVSLVVTDADRFADSVLDQRVTGAGLGHLLQMNLAENYARVAVANATKFVDGEPLFKEGGKWDKGPCFVAPVMQR